MPEFSLPLTTGSTRSPTTHPVHQATALLQEALHDSRRATFTREFGEARGIHRLSAPPAAEVFVDSETVADFVSQPTNLAFVGAHLGSPPNEPQLDYSINHRDDDQAFAPQGDTQAAATGQTATPQLRGLIHDFQERQRKASLIVAGSVASAVTLTVVTIALVFALAA
ncbi:MAG: hypothetical protein QNJ62_12365 [Methyloceanibacter sp.]|nr:hypothetical protein [Methyloceanibacter sp.]